MTLWFAEGSNANWNSNSRTYSDGNGTVTVTGTANITLRFGAEDTLPPGALSGDVSEFIFEERDKGMLA